MATLPAADRLLIPLDECWNFLFSMIPYGVSIGG